ncbi:hypothetical protein IEQ34_013249 [Dendrobium chrysotoxum]|uniref:DUF4283 domain-containing protein n=1 Tax=Dendrobium chrysotoxum TaxID=161865 RepID=A0AAV7G7W5_DENCH|nr:hypothetical protein IEQ34_013249 [Dendrobium chrysotoxum]
MKLIKWSPFFEISMESSIIPIWVSFPNLQPHFFSLYPSRSCPLVAHILVELDIIKTCGLGLKILDIFNKLRWRSSLIFVNIAKSWIVLKIDCFILHPHFEKDSMNIPRLVQKVLVTFRKSILKLSIIFVFIVNLMVMISLNASLHIHHWGYIQHVEMEAFLPFCDHCKSLGHSKINYHILDPHLDKFHLNISKPDFDGTIVTSDNMLNVHVVHEVVVSI